MKGVDVTEDTRTLRSSWMDDAARERFWSKVDRNGPLPDASDPLVTAPPTPCHIWTGATHHGYGVFHAPEPRVGRTGVAHRLIYMEMVEPVRDGDHVDHLCRNHACVNIEHLRAVSHRVNILAGATVPAARAARTHCPAGHEYDERNTHISAKRQRACRECRRIRAIAERRDPAVKAKRAAEARAYRARLRHTIGR